MFSRAVTGSRLTIATPIASAVAGLVLAGCGGGATQAASERSGKYQVDVASATFPVKQRLAQHADMVIVLRNSGTKPIPNIAVTITDAGDGTGAQAFSEPLHTSGLAYASRPVWIVDQAPCPAATSSDRNASGACAPIVNGVPQPGGPGGAVTAYSNTWALGAPLPVGRSVTFQWGVTAVKPGTHVVHYQVAAGLNGKAKAVYAGGQPIHGTFVVHIAAAAQQAYVNDAGQVVNTP
jgi:hypothetical protein